MPPIPPQPTQPLIEQQLADIAAMENAFEQTSCVPQSPFVTYPTTGTPPVLDFNIPQTTEFTTYGRLLKYIDPTWFQAFCLKAPTYNFYDYVKTLTPAGVQQLFHGNVVVAKPAPVMHAVATGSTPVGGATATGGRPLINPGTLGIKAAAAPPIGQVNPQAISGAVADFAAQGIRGLYTHRFLYGGATVKYIAQPSIPVPRIAVIEEYTTGSFLGDFGAGRVVKTFSLLPGEKTTISVRTYKDQSSTSSASDNMLDSFSDSAATELDNLLQQETGVADSSSATSGGNDTSYNTYSNSHNSTSAWNVSGSLNFSIAGLFGASVGGGYGQSTADTSTGSGGFASSNNYSATGARSSNVNTLTNALQKSVQQSNSARQMEINHTTSSTADSGEEDVTVREIQNVNLSRVLNFTWRQLLQQYITITYLSNLKFAYTNGYTETATVVDISNLSNMLSDIIVQGHVNDVLCMLLSPYCNVLDYEDNLQPFVGYIDVPYAACLPQLLSCSSLQSETLYRKLPGLQQTYTSGDTNITVPGIILNVTNQTLYTDSLIADALLGAGEALDCYNQKAQDATTMAAYINNLQAMQALENSIQTTSDNENIVTQQQAIVQAVLDTPDAVNAATLYKKVFGDCCDVPQNTDCGGCGCA